MIQVDGEVLMMKVSIDGTMSDVMSLPPTMGRERL